MAQRMSTSKKCTLWILRPSKFSQDLPHNFLQGSVTTKNILFESLYLQIIVQSWCGKENYVWKKGECRRQRPIWWSMVQQLWKAWFVDHSWSDNSVFWSITKLPFNKLDCMVFRKMLLGLRSDLLELLTDFESLFVLESKAQIFSTTKLSLNNLLGFLSTLGFARLSDEWRMTRGALWELSNQIMT